MKKALEELYHNYYHLEKEELYFDIDKDFFRFLISLSKIDNTNSLKREIHLFKKDKNSLLIEKVMSGEKNEDVPDIEKEILNIRIPLMSSFEKLHLIDNILSAKEAINIFEINISEIIIILNAIFIRVIMYNECFLNSKKQQIYKKLFINDLSCFFNSNEISKLIPDMKIEKIEKFLELFAIDFYKIKSIKDTYKIIKINELYVAYSIHYLFSNFFCVLENKIIRYYNENSINPEQYRIKRGEEFEKFVYNITNAYFSNKTTHLNKYYIYETKKQELDVLQCLNDAIIYIECKSAVFDVYEIESDKKLFLKMVAAFGKGYESVNTFHKYCNSDATKKIFYRNEKNFFSINTHDKKIVSIILSLNDIEYISGNVQLFKNKSFKKPDYYPITLNFSDYLALIYYSGKTKSKDKFLEYLIRRHEIINGGVKYGLGSDEIDAFGMLTDVRKKYNINRFIKATFPDSESEMAEIHFNVGNGFYRESVNEELDGSYLPFVIENFFDIGIIKQVKEILDMQ